MAAPRTEISTKLDALERKYGRGPTYSRSEAKLILSGVVPEWLMRAAKFAKDGRAERATRAVDALRGLYDSVASELDLKVHHD